jgi:CheY-like chemotaxis protein
MASILLIQADLKARYWTTVFLLEAEHRVVAVETGQEALTLLERKLKVDLVLTDLLFRESADWEVVEQIQRDYPHLPVIILYAKNEGATKAQQRDVDNVLHRPFSRQELLEIVQAALLKK